MSADGACLTLVSTLQGHAEPRVWHCAWSPSGATLASCGEDRTIRLWGPHPGGAAATGGGGESEEWYCVAVLEEGHQRTIRWCAWSPDAKFMASCSFDGTASVWECVDGDFDCVASLEGHENEVKAVGWSASGSLLATCGRDKSVFIWEAEDEAYEVAAVLHSHGADVKALAWHPKLETLASASYDDTLKLYAQGDDDWGCTLTLSGHTSTVWALAFSPEGAGLVSCSDDRSLILWVDRRGDASFERAATLESVHERPIYAVDWSEATSGDGLIATASGDDAIGLVRPTIGGGGDGGAASLELLGTRAAAHSNDVNSVAWRPSASSGRGGMLASAGDDGGLRLWRTAGVAA